MNTDKESAQATIARKEDKNIEGPLIWWPYDVTTTAPPTHPKLNDPLYDKFNYQKGEWE